MDENAIKVYLPTVELLKLTTKIESLLEHLGGVGSGVYEKVKSIETRLPQGFVDRIIRLAEIRNDAVHGKPHIKYFEKVVAEANQISDLLEAKAKMKRVKIDVDRLINQHSRYAPFESLPNVLQNWVNRLNTFVEERNYDDKKAKSLLVNEKEMFEILHKTICYYAQRSTLKALAIYGTLLILAGASYIVMKHLG